MKTQKYIRAIFLIGMLFCFSCKTYQLIDWINPKLQKENRLLAFEERQLARLKVGDSIYINRVAMEPLYMIYESSSNDSIFGSIWKKRNKKLETPIISGVPLNEIQSIRVRKFDLASTILFFGLGVPLIGIAGAFFAVLVMGGGVSLS